MELTAFSDVHLCGYLRKQKSHRRRYFVLRCASERGPPRLECYENEKKFRAGGLCSRPKRIYLLASVLNINKRADARHRYLIVLYGRDGTFGVAAEDADQQQMWYAAMVELHGKGKVSSDGNRDTVVPGPAFKEVWQVSLRPRGLGHTKNLAGAYLLCLTEKTINFVKLNSDVAAVVLQLLNVRRCGHSENYFFMEVGRSAVTGPGELWMQVEDLVVAQNMHETILEAMKALSDEFRVRSKSESLASTPISVPPRRQHLSNPPPSQGAFPWRPLPDGTPSLKRSPIALGQKGSGPRKPDSLSDYSAISSDEGGSSPGESRPPSTPDPLSYMLVGGELDYISMGKLASSNGHCLAKWALGAGTNKRASLPPMALDKDTPSLPRKTPALTPVAVSASYPEGLNLRSTDPGYVAMLPGVAVGTEDRDYVPMTPGSVSPPQESGGYMLMSPSGSCSPDVPSQWGPNSGEGKSLNSSDYMNMSPVSRSASSTPPEYSPLPAIPGGAPFYSLPRSYKHVPRVIPCPFNPGRLSCSSSTSSESLEESAGVPGRSLSLFFGLSRGRREVPAAPRSPGEYVSIGYGPRATADYVSMDVRALPAESSRGVAMPDSYAEMAPGARLVRACPQGRRRHCSETFPEVERSGALPCEAQTEPGLNYIDLDLVNETAPALCPSAAPDQAGLLHSYASIDFHRSGELRGCRGADSEGADS
ncbi:insulin receptor substrate 1-like [Rhineura floridana]|uniref:insulin receptor substrate 1-like n=1 Tax=Rhineura floridana TaxID=261503 RepID=UPI002AC87A00|nr:insulin receptor substrate 1-like [Rhineura floridana]